MAQLFDIKSTFNDATFSDVTIKFSDREIKCHRMVLCQASVYFKKLCGPDSQFAENRQKVIELKEDHPDAVEAMLRYMYNIPYSTIMTTMKEKDGRELQMGIFMVGQKYLIKDLEKHALVALTKHIHDLSNILRRTKDSSSIFSVYLFIVKHQDRHYDLKAMRAEFVKNHLATLIELAEFRKTLEENENKDTLNMVIRAVKTVYQL